MVVGKLFEGMISNYLLEKFVLYSALFNQQEQQIKVKLSAALDIAIRKRN